MKLINRLKCCALAALLMGFTGMALAEHHEPTAEQLAADAAQAQLLADLAALEANRDGVVSGILAVWGSSAGSEEELANALNYVNDQQLLALQDAASFNEVRDILGGGSATTLEGVIGTEQLGEVTKDLVFSPVVPCRIFDTRFGDIASGFRGPFGGNPGTVKNYNVQGTQATMVRQGGGNNDGVSGCRLPSGSSQSEPRAMAANFTVVPSGTGHIRVWPYNSPQPNASFLNYRSGNNLANAGIVATCYLCGPELSVSTWFGTSHSLADVMGYFFPAEQEPPVEITSTGSAPAATCTNIASITVFPNSRGYWDVEATVEVHIDNGPSNSFESLRAFLSTSPTTCNGPEAEHQEVEVNAQSVTTIFVQRSFLTGAVASEVFYLNAIATLPSGPFNHTHSETMQATFYASP